MGYVAEDRIRQPLYVIVVLSNWEQWKSRGKHYARAVKSWIDEGAVVYTVEARMGEREFAVDHHDWHGKLASCAVLEEYGLRPNDEATDDERLRHRFIGVQCRGEGWIKESLIRIGMAHLSHNVPNWRNVAWVDADWIFNRPNWVGKTLHLLQRYAFLQLFSHYVELGPNYEAISPPKTSFVKCWKTVGGLPPVDPGNYYEPMKKLGLGMASWSPGGAWAARRRELELVGGLMDFNIVGGGDNQMAYALIGEVEHFFYNGMTEGYKNALLDWQRKALTHVRKNIGYLEGHCCHMWHGSKDQRGYKERWRILADNGFDPNIHLQRDSQGLITLVDRGDDASIAIRDGLRANSKERNEDSIDVK